MMLIRSIFAFVILSKVSFAQIHFSENDRLHLRNQVIKDYELVFILDSVGRKILSDCVVQSMEEYFNKYGRQPLDTINVWYSKSKQSCIAHYKNKLNNCYSRWSAFPAINEGTMKLFEEFVPVIKKIRVEDKQLVISIILAIFKKNYPKGLPFNVPTDKLNSMLNELQVIIAKNPKLKKYI